MKSNNQNHCVKYASRHNYKDAANLIRSALRSSSVRKGQKISICHHNLGFLHDLQGTVGIKGYLTIQFYKSNHVCEDIQEHFSCVENVFNHDYVTVFICK